MNKITFKMNSGDQISFQSQSNEAEVRQDMAHRKVLEVPLGNTRVLVNVCNIAYTTVEPLSERTNLRTFTV